MRSHLSVQTWKFQNKKKHWKFWFVALPPKSRLSLFTQVNRSPIKVYWKRSTHCSDMVDGDDPPLPPGVVLLWVVYFYTALRDPKTQKPVWYRSSPSIKATGYEHFYTIGSPCRHMSRIRWNTLHRLHPSWYGHTNRPQHHQVNSLGKKSDIQKARASEDVLIYRWISTRPVGILCCTETL